MLATGSISSTANEAEYNKAYNFLKSLSGSNEIDEEIAQKSADINYEDKPDGIAERQKEIEELKENHVIVVDPTTTTGTSSLEDAFEQILEQIQQPRNDYTVQDYIDPRFNLIGTAYTYDTKNHNPIEVIYHLGADGKITFTDTNNKPIKSENGYIYFATGNGSSKISYSINGVTVEDIIDKSDANGLAYTPRDSYMVNRTSSYNDKENKYYYDNGDGTGTGYLYYDDDKDMYYLRWENQVIPMEDETFDTTDGGKKLDVWSATIRLKAKDDFIGGNNILTNGNEAGENLVYSDATIENMDKNPDLYFTDGEEDHTLREKLQVLSGTDRKINAVDAGGVSQAVYGDGIDIPSSGFPRVTVNVRLKPLDAQNLNDVIYMGEVVSPTMMLTDLEDGYMEGSYYLEYLRRYAYRVYGYDADKMPLIELLNQWLKIDDEDELTKAFTIPYIYLPDPEYNDKGKLVENSIKNSTGWDLDLRKTYKFEDPNLRDVTGFITYTWKREYAKDEEHEPQQVVDGDDNITQEYVVKNTNQIKYNLQLKFTPLQEGALPDDFKFDNIFITDKDGTNADKFFGIDDKKEFVASATEWSIDYNRADYLQAMVKEQHTYTPHVAYNETSKKWELKESTAVTDKDTYDWNKEYKPVVGSQQIEGENLTKYYTQTPDNVGFADKYGNQITDQTGDFTGTNSKENVCSLVANTTYVKDVVNGALALELCVDGKYLADGSEINPTGTTKTYTFEAIRYYDDPIDPLPYGKKDTMNADTTSDGKKYRLTFEVDKNSLPEDSVENTVYTVWAKLTKVEVFNGTGYDDITKEATSKNNYIGYEKIDALPIGTYVIDTTDNSLKDKQFKIGKNGETDVNFIYLKTDNAPVSYTYDKFPESVYDVSSTAPESTDDDEYLIKNGTTDYSQKNVANSDRKKSTDNQTVTFYFGTDNKDNTGNKGVSRITDKANDYAKDRLGIILLSVDPNSLAISKTVTNLEIDDPNLQREWQFEITFKPDSAEDNMADFEEKNNKDTGSGFELKWYTFTDGKWESDTSTHSTASPIHFAEPDKDGKYTAMLYLKHNEKVVITGLQEGTWQVIETDETEETVDKKEGIFYSAHNNMDEKEDHEFSNKTSEDIQLNPASHVDFENVFPYELPSTGDIGTDGYIFLGTMLAVASVLLIAKLWYNRRKRRAIHE